MRGILLFLSSWQFTTVSWMNSPMFSLSLSFLLLLLYHHSSHKILCCIFVFLFSVIIYNLLHGHLVSISLFVFYNQTLYLKKLATLLYRQRMNGTVGLESDYSEFAEVDPTGRYGRYNEILGKGASKTVYRAFDEYDGIEVAWNQVKLHDLLQSPEELERLYCEINLLKSLKHKNIMKFYISWVDTENRNINFVTEMFTSGTLRQYRLKHRRVNMRAVKHWCRQILLGLLYLHSHDPPIIHRDLKCDNIFVNGNQGEVKIGDLGLAAILRKSLAASCVGTPEFMAPEVYEEEYNELVDIYSFGMCVLEMVTFEYPYSECSHPAQIYKKVISGRKPESLYKVKDPEVRRFVEKCLASVSDRLSALELLNDPFLEFDGDRQDLGPFLRQPEDDSFPNFNSWSNGYSNYQHIGHGDDSEYDVGEFETSDMDFFACHEDEQFDHVDISIRGRRKEDEDIFLRLRIGDKEGRMRNIYFPFDVENDTALDVATEMVAELDMADQDVSKIADMIDGEIASLVPEWKKGQTKMETLHSLNSDYCQNCSSNAPYLDYATPNNLGGKNLQVLHCPRHGCAAVHGRFEEITYQVEGSEQSLTEGAPVVSSQSDGMHYADIWGQRDGPEMSSHGSEEVVCSSEGHEPFDQSNSQKDERIISKDNEDVTDVEANPSPADLSCGLDLSDVYENEIRQELRWLKAKYQIQLRELRDQQLGVTSKPTNGLPRANTEQKNENAGPHSPMSSPELDTDELLKSFADGKQYSSFSSVHDVKRGCNFSNGLHNLEATDKCCSPHQVFTAKSFYAGSLLPQSLHRATSLPVGAIDF